MTLTTGSLFSGYAGLDMAVNAYFGSETVWFGEYDSAPSKILAHHWPDVPNHGDITTIDWAAVEPVDILTGGYPCQPFSAAGRRKGTTDERHLWPYVREAIRHLRPRYTVLENVAGHRSLGFDRVLGDMAEDGLHAQWCSVRASDVGACHRRERVFILVTPADAERNESERQRGSGVIGVASGAPESAEQERERDGDATRGRGAEAVALLPTPRAMDGHGSMVAPAARQHVADGNGSLPEVLGVQLLPTPNASDGTGGGQHPDKREGHSRQLIDYVLLFTEEQPDANPTESVSGQDVRDMRGDFQSEAIQRATGRPGEVQDKEDLLTVVREHADASPAGQPSVACASDSQPDIMHRVWVDGKPACPPQGSKPGEQPGREPGDTLRELPSQAALARGSAVSDSENHRVDWGPYEAAIRRQERVTGRPAPNPTEPNRRGKPRLSAEFASWMMMLPAGHVTDPAIGLSRNEQLKALGNGVVPAQALAALTQLVPVAENLGVA